ncbi:MAG: FAD:protein FMN transferase [Clostridiales bacterium]|nr:FAD:protein FMN transferase [Clostridiales bacterium]
MRRTALLCIALAFLAMGCTEAENGDKDVSASSLQLDTVVTITLYGTSDETIIEAAFGEIDRLEKILSRKQPGSDLARLAESSGKDLIEVSPDTIFLLEESEKYSRETRGLFDVTIGPLVSLWDITGDGYYPTDEERRSAYALVNHDKVLTSGNRAMLKTMGMEADFGAIAKGYIADKVKAFLIEKGVESGVINLGGNVLLIGGKPGDGLFRIGVENPDEESDKIMGMIEIADKSLVSSGPYERNFTYEGKKYHHILNPKTGFPVDNELLQVTVISDESITGDALSTCAFLLGLEQGMELIDNTPGVSAIFVTKDKQVYLSMGFGEKFTILDGEYSLAGELR